MKIHFDFIFGKDEPKEKARKTLPPVPGSLLNNRYAKQNCPYDTDGDGNCHIHPKGCPVVEKAPHVPGSLLNNRYAKEKMEEKIKELLANDMEIRFLIRLKNQLASDSENSEETQKACDNVQLMIDERRNLIQSFNRKEQNVKRNDD